MKQYENLGSSWSFNPVPYYQELLGNLHSLFHEFDKLHMKIVPLGALQPFFMLESLIFFCCNPQKKLFFSPGVAPMHFYEMI